MFSLLLLCHLYTLPFTFLFLFSLLLFYIYVHMCLSEHLFMQIVIHSYTDTPFVPLWMIVLIVCCFCLHLVHLMQIIFDIYLIIFFQRNST